MWVMPELECELRLEPVVGSSDSKKGGLLMLDTEVFRRGL